MSRHAFRRLLLAAGLLAAAAPAVAGPPGGDPQSAGSRWGAEYFPNVTLTTHEGEQVRFFDDLIKDKVVAINFIYTSCPDSCPLETARLAQVQGILGDRMGEDVFFYSISIDPERDTPEVLKRYAATYQAGPGWLFLTGDEDEIIGLRKKLGLYIAEIQDDSGDHNLSLIIGNQATGRWMKRSPFENPYVLAEQMGGWLHDWRVADGKRDDYSNAPELRDVTRGETLFRTRCAACHTIGGGDRRGADRSAVGPDLLGVTRIRDPAWLVRWMAEPDRMLAEEDPLALALLAKFNDVAMPNLRLNPLEVRATIEYLDAETRRIEITRRIDVLAEAKDAGGVPACCQKDEKLQAPVTAGDEEPGPSVHTAGTTGLPTQGRQGLPVVTVVCLSLGGALGLLSLALRGRDAPATQS